jgi:hypothetical protein
MAAYYDIDFSKRFLNTARTGQRPDLTIYVTNDSSLTPEKLKQAGYKLLQTQGVLTMWVNPMGRQVWLLPPPKTQPPPPPPSGGPNGKAREHPDVEEVRLYADQYKSEQDELLRRSRELRALKPTLSAKEYAEGGHGGSKTTKSLKRIWMR